MTSLRDIRSTDPPSPPAISRRSWIVIFTDLTALLLAFFVLLFAMSGVQPQLWQATAQSLSRTLNPGWEPAPPPVAAFNAERADAAPGSDLDYLQAVLAEVSDDLPILADLQLGREFRALVLTLPMQGMFDDHATLTGIGEQRLATLGGVIRNVGNALRVRVVMDHPDVSAEPEAAAWAPALVRAAAIGNVLRRAGHRRTIEIYGSDAGMAEQGMEGPAAAAARIEFWFLGEERG
ncbi:MAG: hypothetical protein EA406_00710 [Rhodospirillales bacterium]|nr:MAG: hypothetical protein EA406_00710 [Rhodospirillales bacterium]